MATTWSSTAKRIAESQTDRGHNLFYTDNKHNAAFGNDALSSPLVESLRFKMFSHRMYGGDKDTHAGYRTGTITVLELVQ